MLNVIFAQLGLWFSFVEIMAKWQWYYWNQELYELSIPCSLAVLNILCDVVHDKINEHCI